MAIVGFEKVSEAFDAVVAARAAGVAVDDLLSLCGGAPAGARGRGASTTGRSPGADMMYVANPVPICRPNPPA